MDAIDYSHFDYDYDCLEQFWDDESSNDFIGSERLETTVNEIISRLKSAGFSIRRYDSHSTNSIYLKLDNGACNSLRVSDHRGKDYLEYRYNLLTYIDTHLDIKGKYPRYYYNIDDYLFLIDKIIYDRQNKIIRYGANNYCRYVEENKLKHEKDKGFWSKSYEV